MSASPHTLLLASAGTGKTFRLTHRFLDLLLRGDDPGRILATTFTRKAAGEILDRLLRRLVEGATDAAQLAELNDNLSGRQATAQECLELLASLVRSLDRFQVRTLDAFFVHVARLFALDLGLPPGWGIADEGEEERLRVEAFGRLLEEAEPEELIELLRGIQRVAGAGRSVRAAMLKAITDARDGFRESPPEAWDRVVVPAGLDESALEAACARFEAAPLPQTKKGADDSRWVKARDDALAAARRGDWHTFLKAGLGKKVLSGSFQYQGRDLEGELRAAFEDLFAEARHALLDGLRRRNLATRELLARFQEHLEAVERQRALYGFDDLPRILAPASGAGAPDPPLVRRDLDLAFRLDARIESLLLDEFQDTAPVQWRVLRPQAEEILAEGDGARTFFCVGDVKQSIYGWRAAEPRLLQGLPEVYGEVLAVDTLLVSHRSSPVVIDTVNRVFEGVGGSAALAADEREPYRRAAELWQQRFERHEAHHPHPGEVLLLEADATQEGEDAEARVLDLAVRRVQRLVTRFPGATVGVLVRRNQPIPRLIHALLGVGVRASGEGGNPLTDSRAVLHLLSLLHLADHPGDTAAALHLEHSPLWEVARALDPEGGREPSTLSRHLRRAWIDVGVGELCARFLPAVESAAVYGEWDRRRFRQLVELAHAHAPAQGLRADGFVDLVRRQRVEDPAASQVKVMTVHASKGLEFDAVVLPELDAQLHDRGGGLLTDRERPWELNSICSVAPDKTVVALDADLEALARERWQRVMEEALCVLYVAMTRAKRGLEMIVRPVDREKTPMTYATILREALAGGGEADEEGVLWRHPGSSDTWWDGESSAEGRAPAPAPPSLAFAPTRTSRALPRRSPSLEEGPRRVPGRDLLARRDDDATSRGRLIHRWLEEVEWVEELEWDDARLMEIGAAYEPDPERRRAQLEALETWLRHAQVRAALTRPAEPVELWRERPFSVVLEGEDGVERLWSGVFDRVVLEGDPGAWRRATVLDYKTDRASGPDLSERVEHYRPQLEGYRRALAAITGLGAERIEARLLFLPAGELVAI